MDFPVLETKRLKLTALNDDDATFIYSLFTDPNVMRFYDIEPLTELEQAKVILSRSNERFENQSGIRWGIRLQENDELIGTCGFNGWRISSKSTILGYDLSPKYWGHGLMTEAVSALVDFAFNGKLACGEINRIEAFTFVGNIGSEKVLLKSGFTHEGTMRQSINIAGEYHDQKIFGLLKCDGN